MFNRLALFAAALTLFAAAPAFANGAHAPRSASQQGDLDMANFGSTFTGANGISETTFVNNTLAPGDPDITIDIFGIPANFETGTSYTMTFKNLIPNADGDVYGIFDCGNGTSPNPVSADNQTMTGPCTAEPKGAGDAFVSYNENDLTNTVTISFLGGSGAPGMFYFWTTDGNLTNLSPASASGTVPEPGTYVMLASGLLAISLLRRRTANHVA